MKTLNYDNYVELFSNITGADMEKIYENYNFEVLGVDSLTFMNLIERLENNYKLRIQMKELENIFTPLKLFNLLVDKKFRQTKGKEYPLYGYCKLNTIVDLLEYSDRSYHNEYAYIYKDSDGKDVKIKFSKFMEDVYKISNNIAHTYGSHSNIALIGKNSYSWIKTYFGIIKSGNVAVLIDPDLSEKNIINIISESKAKIIFFDNADNRINKSKIDLLKKNKVFLEYNSGKENIFDEKYNYESSNIYRKKDDIATIIYTSGSTGSGKGVILSNYNMISDMIAYARLIEYSNISILCLPLYHAFGLVIVLCASLYYGQTLYVSSGILNLPEELKKFNPYNLCLVPMQIEFLYKEIIRKFQENKVFYPYKNKFLLQKILSFVYFKLSKEKITKIVESVLGKNIQFIVSGGAPMPVHTIKYFQNFGIQVINGYGTSECSPGVSVNRVGNNIMESAGQIFPCNDIIIDNECDTNEIEGEILIKGSNVMKGYYNDPDSTERAFFNGYYRTGDIGKIKNNYLYITGRCKNMILLKNGLNIFPEEIETLIHKLEYVESVMVYAENDLIVAEVYINNSGKRNLIYNDIDKINKSLPYYKRIKKIIIDLVH